MKKAAMFGLLRALIRQSGGLFLVRRHSEASKGENGSFKTNRAAMFGLDARIALAIFGALSVISGAALYSAIGNSKATALLADMNEIGKAWESYLLDTGSDLPKVSSSGNGQKLRITSELIDSSVIGWKGPYLPYSLATDTNFIKHSNYGEVHLASAKSAQWGAAGDWRTADSDCTATDCHMWVHINAVDSGIKELVDEMVDGGDGRLLGDFRWYTSTPAEINDVLFLKYAPYDLP